MLTNLAIKNFAIVSFVEIDWQQGMTTITGETGAGKSIAIDALGLCLGDRATTNTVRPGTDKAEITASFDISQLVKVQTWLQNHDLQQDDECIIRRVISKEGRSKGYINSNPVPLAQLKELGQKLINIHGQHDHQLLLKPTEQRRLVDDFANNQKHIEKVQTLYHQHRRLEQEKQQLLANVEQRQAKQQLLQYQVQELDEFSLQANEFEQLENDFKRNANVQQLMQVSDLCLHQLSDSDEYSALSLIQKCSEQLNQLVDLDANATAIAEMVNEARISLEEASNDLSVYQQNIDIDPQTYALIEERYATAMQLARKHQVRPENLFAHHCLLRQELDGIAVDDHRLEFIDSELDQCIEQYQQAAVKLRDKRVQAAKQLASKITASMQQLNMEKAQFSVQVTSEKPDQVLQFGLDHIEFVASMNPGQPLEAIHKVASGGELSRISLAIQVILSAKIITPTLIFDEVDVGISGPTAAMVGKQLQTLGQSTQVICVTHLPQVASRGHQQLFVAKLSDGNQTQTRVNQLDQHKREQEIARLLAGDEITESSMANARELLAS
ncbi:DNA repair protein RecN [Thalassotalea sp. Y01]|uniref:DNA repair protein RecN n=1 Tax=Thalassotalea sp. Y01 TaxID=2729613 RepID=UPI00145D93ED|nr:DNA repair protein RecN [Thalassotalea sp. Y01]NMP14897.1 DNA repair protein RecN [Thalassotalea sp. Y01]